MGFVLRRRSSAPHFGYEYEIAGVHVLPSAWRKGIGRSLVCRLSQSHVESGHRGMLAWVLSENASVRTRSSSWRPSLRKPPMAGRVSRGHLDVDPSSGTGRTVGQTLLLGTFLVLANASSFD